MGEIYIYISNLFHISEGMKAFFNFFFLILVPFEIETLSRKD